MNWEQCCGEYTEFHTIFCDLINESFPLKEMKTGKRKNPLTRDWHTKELKELKNTLNALHVIHSVKKDHESLVIYNNYREQYSWALQETKKQKINEYLNQSNNKSQAVWSIIKSECRVHKKKIVNRPKTHNFRAMILATISALWESEFREEFRALRDSLCQD